MAKRPSEEIQAEVNRIIKICTEEAARSIKSAIRKKTYDPASDPELRKGNEVIRKKADEIIVGSLKALTTQWKAEGSHLVERAVVKALFFKGDPSASPLTSLQDLTQNRNPEIRDKAAKLIEYFTDNGQFNQNFADKKKEANKAVREAGYRAAGGRSWGRYVVSATLLVGGLAASATALWKGSEQAPDTQPQPVAGETAKAESKTVPKTSLRTQHPAKTQATPPSTQHNNAAAVEAVHKNFGICYGKMTPAQCRGFGTLVLEPKYNGSNYSAEEIKAIKNQPDGPRTLYAYVSLGEMAKGMPQFHKWDTEGVFRRKLPDGNGIVDITNKTWLDHIKKEVAEARAKGFDGVMFDTLDGLAQDMGKNPEYEEAALKAMQRLSEEIRETDTDINLMGNRGYWIDGKGYTTQIHDALGLNAVLMESMIPGKGKKGWLSEEQAKGDNQILHSEDVTHFGKGGDLREKTPHRLYFSIDYIDQSRRMSPEDNKKLRTSVMAVRDDQGFIPFVTCCSAERDPLATPPEPLSPVNERHR